MNRIISLFKRKEASTVDLHKIQLLSDMSNALMNYRRAAEQYELMTMDYNPISANVQLLAADMEAYRKRYYILRIAYEEEYGDLTNYQDRIERIDGWRKETNIVCMHRTPDVLQSKKQSLAVM